MLLDDYPQLEGLLKHADLGLGHLIQEFLYSNSGPLGRPVSMFTFILDANFWGASFWLWKMSSLLLHLTTALSLYWFLTALLRPIPQPQAQKFWIAVFVFAVWMLHPLNVSTVLYTVQRMTILSALFAFLSMSAFIEGRYCLQNNQNSGYAWLVLSIGVFLPLSAFSKENGLLIPLYLVLLEYLFFPQSRWRASWQRLTMRPRAILSIAVGLVGVAVVSAIIQHFVFGGYLGRPFTLTERLLTELRVVTIYLWQIVAPSWSNLGFFHDDIALSKGLLTPPSTLLALVLLASLLWMGFRLRKCNPIVSFGILFFFASHLMESTIFPLELMFEHRNYLGSIGIVIAISSFAQAHVKKFSILPVFAVLIPVALAVVLYQFSHTWGDNDRLNVRLYASHPDSPSVIAITADQYVIQGKPEQAFRLLDRPERIGYQLQSLVIKCNLFHRIEDAELEKLNSDVHGLMLSYELTGLILLSNHWLDRTCRFSDKYFMETLRLAIEHTVNGLSRQKLWMYRAHIFHQIGQPVQAIQSLDAAAKAAPESPMPLFLATEWLLDQGDKKRAKAYYQRAIAASDMDRAISAEYISHFRNRITP
ncbi:MAG TPA: hypothetical protein VK959_07190 [Methylophilaceae bacterium]|nr:hypothetical protein [Methylophilaceae bacterium]